MLRMLTSGESHGFGLVVVVEGLPAGISFTTVDLSRELARRRLGFGRGPRMALEEDRVRIVGGLRHGKTLGSPFSVLIENTEFSEKWAQTMSPDPAPGTDALTQPRPGHADLAGMLKYGFDDARDVLERSSARETAARVAAGAICKAFLRSTGVEILSHVIEVGGISAESHLPDPSDLDAIDEDPLRCFDPDASKAMAAAIEAAREEGDTLGGIFEVVAYGLPVGLGSYVHWDRRLDSRLAAALMSINAVKAVEIGEGLAQARSRGSQAHDEIVWRESSEISIARVTNRAGGIEGGMTTGEPIVLRGAMKPLSSLSRPLSTVDLATGEKAEAFKQRTDTCAVPAAGVVAEAMVAFTLADAVLEKFGSDTVDEIIERLQTYKRGLKSRIDRVR
jgi:chorismate synthase